MLASQIFVFVARKISSTLRLFFGVAGLLFFTGCMSAADRLYTLRELHDPQGGHKNQVPSRTFLSSLIVTLGGERGMSRVSDPPAYCQELVLELGNEDLKKRPCPVRAGVVEWLSFVARNDESPLCRASAAHSLGKLLRQFAPVDLDFQEDLDAGKKALEFLKEIEEVFKDFKLREDLPGARILFLRSIEGLGELATGTSKTGRSVLKLLGGVGLVPSQDPEIAAALERSVERIAGLTIGVTLLEVLEDEVPAVRLDAALNLSRFMGERALSSLLLALERETDFIVKKKLIHCLGNYGKGDRLEPEQEERIRGGLLRILDSEERDLAVLAMMMLRDRTGVELGFDGEAWKTWWEESRK